MNIYNHKFLWHSLIIRNLPKSWITGSKSVNIFCVFWGGVLGGCLFCLFVLFKPTPTAYRDSQARGLIGAVAASLHQSHTTSAAYTTAHSNIRSLIHWARPGIKPSTSWFIVGFVSTAPRWERRTFLFLVHIAKWLISRKSRQTVLSPLLSYIIQLESKWLCAFSSLINSIRTGIFNIFIVPNQLS